MIQPFLYYPDEYLEGIQTSVGCEIQYLIDYRPLHLGSHQ